MSKLPITHSVVGARVEVGSPFEDVSWECRAVVRSDHPLVYGLVSVQSVRHFDFEIGQVRLNQVLGFVIEAHPP